MNFHKLWLKEQFQWVTGVQPEVFQGSGGFVELGHFDKLFVKNTKKGAAGKRFGAFLLDILKTTF